MHFRMHDVVSTTDTCGMDVGRYLNISAAPNDGVLSAAAALVVLVVLFWALMPQFWQVPDELPATALAHTGPRSHAAPAERVWSRQVARRGCWGELIDRTTTEPASRGPPTAGRPRRSH